MELEPIVWTIVGIVLILLEFVIPSFIIIFFGSSSLLVGIAILVGMPTNNGIPFVVFALLAILQIVVLRKYFKTWFLGDKVDADPSARELEEYVGHYAIVVSGFENDSKQGKVEFKGANWSAISLGTVNKGDSVEIVARDSLQLTIKPSA